MMSFDEKYGSSVKNPNCYHDAVNDLGFDNVRRLLPWTDKELFASYTVDEHFNTKSTPIDAWDRIAGYSENHITGALTSFGSPLKGMLYKAGVNCFSCSQLICMLKEVAKITVEGYMKEMTV